MLNKFQQQLKKQMHKSQTGMTMFCPACQGILDHKKSVSMDLFKGNDLIWSKVYCRDCYLKAKSALKTSLVDMGGSYLEVYDGKTGDVITYGEEPEIDNSDQQLTLI